MMTSPYRAVRHAGRVTCKYMVFAITRSVSISNLSARMYLVTTCPELARPSVCLLLGFFRRHTSCLQRVCRVNESGLSPGESLYRQSQVKSMPGGAERLPPFLPIKPDCKVKGQVFNLDISEISKGKT